MDRRWQIIRKGEPAESLTASEIRQGLREGVIDPFDIVSLEGSALRRQVLDVEEIFSFEHVDEQLFERASGFQERLPAARPPAPSRPDPLLQENDNSGSKLFFLCDPSGKRLGPLSAREILGLCSRGMLSRKIKVEKIGNDRKVPLLRFVQVYSQRLRRGPRGFPGVPSNALSLRKIDALKTSVGFASVKRESPVLTSLVMLALGCLLGVAAFKSRIFDKIIPPEPPPRTQAQVLLPTKGQMPKPPSEVKKPGLNRRMLERKRPPAEPNLPVLQPGIPPDFLMPAPFSTIPALVPLPVPEPAKSPQVQEGKTQAAPRNALAQKVGKTFVSGPARFNKEQLAICEDKCTLLFQDEDGNTFKGVFFKKAFETHLKGKNKVKVTGIVKREAGGYVIFVEQIQ